MRNQCNGSFLGGHTTVQNSESTHGGMFSLLSEAAVSNRETQSYLGRAQS